MNKLNVCTQCLFFNLNIEQQITHQKMYYLYVTNFTSFALKLIFTFNNFLLHTKNKYDIKENHHECQFKTDCLDNNAKLNSRLWSSAETWLNRFIKYCQRNSKSKVERFWTYSRGAWRLQRDGERLLQLIPITFTWNPSHNTYY